MSDGNFYSLAPKLINQMVDGDFYINPDSFPRSWGELISLLKEKYPEKIIYENLNSVFGFKQKYPNDKSVNNESIIIDGDTVFFHEPSKYIKYKDLIGEKMVSFIPQTSFKFDKRETKKISEIKIKEIILTKINAALRMPKNRVYIISNHKRVTIISIKNKHQEIEDFEVEKNIDMFGQLEVYFEDEINAGFVDIESKVLGDSKEIAVKVNLTPEDIIEANSNKAAIAGLIAATKRRSGIIFVSSPSNSGKTTLMRNIIADVLGERERLINIYSERKSYRSTGANCYSPESLFEGIYSDIVIYDGPLGEEQIRKFIDLSIMGTMVIILNVADNFKDTIKSLYFNHNAALIRLLMEEVVGFYAQQMLPIPIRKNTTEVLIDEYSSIKDINNSKYFVPNSKILIEIHKGESSNGVAVLSEWVENNHEIKSNISSEAFTINDLMLLLMSQHWISIIDVGVDLLIRQEITLNSFLKYIKTN